MRSRQVHCKYLLLSIVGGAALFYFYRKYVPLIPGFQLVLLPILTLQVVAAMISLELGTLVFLFVLPLIGNLPYFFGIQESVPHAPTVLVLFLFFFWAWLVRRSSGLSGKIIPLPVLKPMALAALLIAVSAVITFMRFTNFFPFRADAVYELATNVNGVTAGGARMSTVFHALSYLSEFGFFLVLCGALRTRSMTRKALMALGFGLVLSLGFGFFQHFSNPLLGNTDFWAGLGQINSTFKDPNAFGAYLALLGPMLLGAAFFFRRWKRVLFAAAFAGTVLVYPFIGTRSGLAGLGASVIVFLVLAVKARRAGQAASGPPDRSPFFWAILSGMAILLVVIGTIQFKNSRVFERLSANWRNLRAEGSLASLSPERYFLWKEALEMIGKYPVSGVGMGAYIIELPNYYSKDKQSYEMGFEGWRRNDSAENYFLQVAAELGLPGLLVIVWLFWLITNDVRAGWRKLRNVPENPFIFLGAAAGVISYFINILFHSFIGSLETKLTFWLLVGIIACWVRDDLEKKRAAEKVKYFAGPQKAAAALLTVLFGASLLWNSTHSLSLASRTKKFGLRQDFGFYQLEKTFGGQEFRWTREYGGVTIRVEKPRVEIPLQATHPDIQKDPVRVRLFLIKGFFKEKRSLGEIDLNDDSWRTFEFSIPDEVGREVILLLKVSRTWNPLKETGARDPRNLGVAVGRITFRD
jgi:hypothetical protein